MASRRQAALAVLVAAALLVALPGCAAGGDGGGSSSAPGDRQARDGDRSARGDEGDEADETVAPSSCPPGVAGCRVTEGRIVYVERVDPDGDGDAHFVVADPQGITLPGLTAVDVRRGLRPDPLPGVGDLISAAGPVQTGSYGQSQIHALELHVAGR